MSDRLRKPEGMSDEEWREHLIAKLGFEPRDYVSEVVVSDREGARDIEVTQADGSTSTANERAPKSKSR